MKRDISITPLKRFFNLLKIDKQDIFSIYIYALFNGLVALSLPLGIQAIISLISGGQVSTSWIVLVIIVIVGVALNGIMQIMQLSISENLQQKIFTRSAFEFAYRIPRMKMEETDKTHMPELVNRFFDTLSVQKGLSKILLDFSTSTLQVVFGLILLSLYHPFFILFSLVLVFIVYLIFRYTAPKGLKTSLQESKYKYEVAHWLEELARTMETFKLAGNSPLPLDKTDDLVEDYLQARKAHFKTLLVQYINLVGFKVVVAAGLLLIGGLLVINQQMNIGQFVASEIIIILVLNSVEKLILSMETIYDVLTSVEKIGNVTDIPLDASNDTNITNKNEGGLSLDLTNFTFKFRGQKAPSIQDVNLSIKAGEKLALVGENGSGKSLLLQLFAGIFDEFTGALTYNGVSIRNWNKEELQSQIGDNLLREDIFQGTLWENITLGKPSIEKEYGFEILKVVGLKEFVESLAQGFSTKLLPGGKGLPKSIRIKIILARGLVNKPQLILLDDTFHQLKKSDRNSLLSFLKNEKATVIGVSNDSEVLNYFDKVAFVANGRIPDVCQVEAVKNKSWFKEILEK